MSTADFSDFSDGADDGDESLFGTDIAYAEVQHIEHLLRTHQTDLATVAGFSDEEIDALHAKGLDLLRTGMFQAAGSVFHGLIQLKPMEGKFYLNLGLSLHYERVHNWARILYGQALAFDPEDRIAMALRAECTLVVLGKKEALPELEKVVAKGARNHFEQPYVARAEALLNKMTIYRVGER